MKPVNERKTIRYFYEKREYPDSDLSDSTEALKHWNEYTYEKDCYLIFQDGTKVTLSLVLAVGKRSKFGRYICEDIAYKRTQAVDGVQYFYFGFTFQELTDTHTDIGKAIFDEVTYGGDDSDDWNF
jgi:hypothetical protein